MMLVLNTICEQLLNACHARVVAVLDASGMELARAGADLPLAPPAILKLLGDGRSALAQVGDEHVHVSPVAGAAVVVVAFDNSSSIGLVRLQVRKAADAFSFALRATPTGSSGAPPAAAAAVAKDTKDKPD